MDSDKKPKVVLTDNVLENIKIMAPYLDEASQNRVFGMMLEAVKNLQENERKAGQGVRGMNYIRALQGITFTEWIKLKVAVDRSFDMQKGEFEKTLKLANCEEIERLIQSQFGRTQD